MRPCICGNFEEESSTATYAGGCDASQIRCLVRHAALQEWEIYGTDIKCAFLNAERTDHSKVIAMTIPGIYVKLGAATAQEVWLVDAAMYGLTSSPRDWSDHRDKVIPAMAWQRKEGSATWVGGFRRAADQHLWHLREECVETGERVNRGLMAIYVDDVLLAAGDKVAPCALDAIAAVWECAKPEKACLDQSVTFCGFEVQKNQLEHGGGFRLHQASYEEELLKKWSVHSSAMQLQFKLPTPEEEAEMQKSESPDEVRQAQACTGALLWLATRTRPELSVGAASMSRLCTKSPGTTLHIGKKIMEYLKRPTLGLIYGATCGPEYGDRQQLSLPRCQPTVEAFSDISYASTKGYRSVQGQVYFYAGAPIIWSSSRQSFPTQSTAESELVGLCEALVGGRATAALVASVRDEKEEDLRKRLWGDNSAAISLATGEGQGSWRTRHLRIRASILRAALHQGEWQLGHLNGKELVADSFTKVVDGQAFERALQDLCVGTTKSKNLGEGGVRSDMINAKIAMLVGSTLLSTAKASDGMEKDDDMFWLWTCGLILMCVGAVYVCSKAYRSGVRLYKRLSGASGDHSGPKVKEHGTEPQLKMLRLSSSEEESDEGVQRRTDLRARQRLNLASFVFIQETSCRSGKRRRTRTKGRVERMMMQLWRGRGNQCCKQHPIFMAHLHLGSHGHSRAQAALWWMIHTECGHSRAQAALWWMIHTECGHSRAQAALWWMIHTECGHSRAQAALWWKIHAECGHLRALAALWWMSHAE